MSGTFIRLTFKNQIDLISQDLQDNFWQKHSKVLAVSYGANMLLHVLADIDPYLGSILLLSPVRGSVTNAESMHYFNPPRPNRLMGLIEDKEFPIPNKLEMHVSDSDWQSPYERAIQFAESVGGIYVCFGLVASTLALLKPLFFFITNDCEPIPTDPRTRPFAGNISTVNST